MQGEGVYMKDRRHLDFSNPYKSFPFIKKGFGKAFILPINDDYHDKLFPYSEVARNTREVEEVAAGNGMSKVFIGFPSGQLSYIEGKPILVYRIHTGDKQKTYASCITSFCTIQKVIWVTHDNIHKLVYEEFKSLVGNKAVFSDDEISLMYRKKRNMVVVELVYNGFFGKGCNITHSWLKENGIFNGYPYDIEFSENDFIKVLEAASVNVQNVVID